MRGKGDVWETGEVLIEFWWGNLRKKRKLGRHRLRWNDNFKMDLQELGLEDMYGLCWLRIGTYVGVL
jgi:hypothetical protein